MNPNTRRYARVSAGVFAIVALLQGWRAARGFAVVIEIPFERRETAESEPIAPQIVAAAS